MVDLKSKHWQSVRDSRHWVVENGYGEALRWEAGREPWWMSRDGERARDKGTVRVPRNNDKSVSQTLLDYISYWSSQVVTAQNEHDHF